MDKGQNGILMEKISQLIDQYKTKKLEIEKRLEEFINILKQSDERIFAELAFCICTPQSKAITCWNAISSLTKNNLLFQGNAKQIRPFLNAVRFGDKKASYIVEARNFFTENGKLKIKGKIQSFKNVFALREWLANNIKGIYFKEASHFLRNIGLGSNLAILDIHILKNLKEYRVIEDIPKTLTKETYLEIENKMRKFSKKIKIPMSELDLLLWSEETGKIFK